MNQILSIRTRAVSEWEQFCARYGIQSVPLSLLLSEEAALSEDGYRIDAENNTARITAKTERGLLYGVFRLIDRCRIGGTFPEALHETQNPAFETRMVWSWSRLDKAYRHAPYLNFQSMINPETIADPENSLEMLRFLRHLAQMGVNALALTHELHHFEIEDFDQHGFRPFYPQLRSFSEYLKSWGIDLYLYSASAPEADFKKRIADTDCSFDPRVRTFWEETTEEIFTEIPALGGLLLAGGLGGYAGGSLYDCSCEYCRGKSSAERVREQIFMIADCLKKYGKKLIYTVTTDVPFTMDREVSCVLNLKDEIPENTILSFKDCYHDFEELRYPEHPLFGRLETLPEQKPVNLAVEYQLFQEMRGKGVVLSNIAEMWSGIFRRAAALQTKAVIGVAETHPDDAHPAMADWYAWGRLCWEPALSADELLSDWASIEYGRKAAPVLTEILKDSYLAAGKLFYAAGVQNGSHGMIIPFPHFVRDILNDTWCPKEKQPDGIIGSDDRQIFLYTEERQKELLEGESFTLFAHAHRVDSPLIAQLLNEKEEAVALYRAMSQKWQDALPHLPAEGYQYRELSAMLRKNAVDAERIYAYFKVFLDWQGGQLAENEIEETRRAFIGTGADCSVYTCDALFGAFLTHLQDTLEGRDFDKSFDCVYDLPQYDGKQPIWQVAQIG